MDPARLFAFAPREIRLEIGFGGGEHLLARASAEPDVGFLGCEFFLNGVAKALAGIESAGLINVRVCSGDARALIDLLPFASLARIDMLYPDPWPKRRQVKRRIICDELVSALAQLLRPGGEFRFASDIDDYVGWTLARVLAAREFGWIAQDSRDWREPWSGWPSTRYEAKARREGRSSTYLTFVRR